MGGLFPCTQGQHEKHKMLEKEAKKLVTEGVFIIRPKSTAWQTNRYSGDENV